MEQRTCIDLWFSIDLNIIIETREWVDKNYSVMGWYLYKLLTQRDARLSIARLSCAHSSQLHLYEHSSREIPEERPRTDTHQEHHQHLPTTTPRFLLQANSVFIISIQ